MAENVKRILDSNCPSPIPSIWWHSWFRAQRSRSHWHPQTQWRARGEFARIGAPLTDRRSVSLRAQSSDGAHPVTWDIARRHYLNSIAYLRAISLTCSRVQLLWQSKASGAVQTGCGTLGLSSIGAVSGLSAHFTAGSSQLIHCKSVRPAMVITGTIRFSHFRQYVVRSIKSSPVFPT